MKKGVKRFIAMILVIISLSAVITVSAAEKDDYLDCNYIKIQGEGFVCDSLNGVDAIYNLYGSTMQCTEFVRRYYSTIYGVTIYQRSTGPVIVSETDCYLETLTDEEEPQAGDIVFWPVNVRNRAYSHIALVKSYEDGVITLIEQNWRYAGKCAYERTVSWPSKNYDVFHLVDPNAPVFTAAVDDIVVIEDTVANVSVESTPCTASDLISLSVGALSGKVSVSMTSGTVLSLVMGLEDGESYLTRQEAFIAIEKLLCASGVEMPDCNVDEALTVYSDYLTISAEAAEAIANLTELGVLSVGLERKCSPRDILTYEQCQVIMMRVAALIG